MSSCNAMTATAIVFATINRYLKAATGCRAEFVFRKNRLCPAGYFLPETFLAGAGHCRQKSPAAAFRFGSYPPLALFYRAGDRRALALVRSHYKGIHSLKAGLQRAYFSALQYPVLRPILNPADLEVMVSGPGMEKVRAALGSLIWGGFGSKVKLFNFADKKIISILKEGCDARFFRNELMAREKFQQTVPIPKLLESDPENLFFSEEYHDALPLRSLDHITWPLVAELVGKLFSLYEGEGLVVKQSSAYTNELRIQIETGSGKIPAAQKMRLFKTLAALDMGKTQEEIVGPAGQTMIVQSHGDFWLGNILRRKADGRLLLVDWERSAPCSLLHDFFTLLAIHALEQNDFRSFEQLDRCGKNDATPLQKILAQYAQRFQLPPEREWLKGQMVIFILERIAFALYSLPPADQSTMQAPVELEKWCGFFDTLTQMNIFRTD